MVTGARPASKRLGDRTRANRARAATVDLVIVALRDACGRAPWPAPLEATSLAASLLDADARFACIAIDALEGCRRAPLRPVCPGIERAGAIADELLALADDGEAGYAYALRCAVDSLIEGDAAYQRLPFRTADRRAAILFIGDGRPGADVPDASAECELLRQRGWPVFTVGVGAAASESGAEAVLRTMAIVTRGAFFSAATADELVAACGAAIAELRGRGKRDGMPAGRGGADRGGA
jgi:hypothetical protein